MGIIIYHNPQCRKSQETLRLIYEKTREITIVEYLKKPPGMFELKNIIRFLGCTPRDILRKSESLYKTLHLEEDRFTDLELIKIMAKYPILIERPIVVNGEKAVMGRPPENVLNIL